MRVLLVNSAWPASWGGGEKWTTEAACWLQARHHAVRVVARPRSLLAAAVRERGVVVDETPFGGDFNPFAVWRAVQLIRAHSPDVIVVNFNKEAWQFGLAGRMLNIPVVARHGFPLLRPRIHHRFLSRSILTRIVVNARSLRESYQNQGFNVGRIEVIENGVAPAVHQRGALRNRFQILDDDMLVLAAGRLEPQKRFDLLIEAAARLAPSRPKLRFLIAGEGPLRGSLLEQIKRCALQSDVQLVGFVEHLAELVGDADLFVLTSDNEGTPNVLLEAMISGVACVAFSVGAVPQIFDGELVVSATPFGDVAALAERMAVLIDNSPLRKSVAQQMKARASESYSLDASLSHFVRLLEDTVRDRS